MPRPRQYDTRAAQQAAYRNRQRCSQQELLARKGLPALPAIPTMPGHARWRAMIEQAHLLLSEATQEMQTYHDDRSELWQDSPQAAALLDKLEHLQETMAQLEDLD
jgi:hypothetical protein